MGNIGFVHLFSCFVFVYIIAYSETEELLVRKRREMDIE